MARLQTLRALGTQRAQPEELKALEECGRHRRDAPIRARWICQRRCVVRRDRHGDAHGKERADEPRRRGARALSARVLGSFSSASTRLALDPYLVLALSRQESLFNPRATSSSNARGLMQLIPSTARKMASQNGIDTEKIRLYDPSVNVELGTTYLKNLFEMFHGDAFHAVAAYNAGENAVVEVDREISRRR